MNTLQFYYANTVLGVSSVIQPKKIRSAYRLRPHSIEQIDFLFFCDPINKKEDKILIQKIAKAIGSSEYLIAEILDSKNSHIPFMLNNLLTRFLPKGFVIFGNDLSDRLTEKCSNPLPAESATGSAGAGQAATDRTDKTKQKNQIFSVTKTTSILLNQKKSLPKQIKWKVSINHNKQYHIPGCILNEINDFTGPNSPELQKKKQSAWSTLIKTFPQQPIPHHR